MVWSARARMEGSLSSSKVCKAVTDRNRAEMSACACRDPQASPPDHAPYSPLQISDTFSSLWSLSGRAASPRHKAASDPLLPSTLPPAQPLALPAGLHPLSPSAG